MFHKILIANRGEIACRVITTARKLGVKTVAVYSDADADAKHVALADEAIHIGSAAVADSYLRGDRIIAAALATGAQAIHPGYGLLSENPEFVAAVEAENLTFIGPSVNAIKAMGLKDAAKSLMVEAGVPVVPGYHGAQQDPAFLAGEADKIGYPVLIKARAGGGGKGMRLVEDPKDFADALEGAQREGLASFGDAACLIEKFVMHPRHIEIQVFGDSHGNVVHLFERDCSLQRRHQKVIEEAPAPDMPADVRAAMGQAAVEAAKAVRYTGAGTVEFIVDGSGPLRTDGFWFMEMNTRLQVEHPVSEAITGLDFVELQLRVASGEPLPVQQQDLSINGWAFEARVYAEDVPKGFLPATGVLSHLNFPQGADFSLGSVRVDSGVREGDEISPWYDPMIAKVIVHGPSRTAALNMLAQALEGCHVAGCVTNLEFLGALSKHTGFGRGKVDTGLIARDLDALTERPEPSAMVKSLAALSGLNLLEGVIGQDPWDRLIGWRQWSTAKQFITFSDGDDLHSAEVSFVGDGVYDITFTEDTVNLRVSALGAGFVRVETGGRIQSAKVVTNGTAVSVFVDGLTYAFRMRDLMSEAGDDHAGGDAIMAPMPGLVQIVSAQAGVTVEKGQPLIVLEAMKMEHTLRAPRDGVVAEVFVKVGDQVTDGLVLLQLDPEDE